MKKMVKKEKTGFKKNIVYSAPEMKHYLGVLNEMHGETLKVIREGNIITDRKIDSMKEILDSHTEMIGVLMEDVSSIKYDLKKKVDYDDFLALVRRVQKIESKI
jgi:hypothetical protein